MAVVAVPAGSGGEKGRMGGSAGWVCKHVYVRAYVCVCVCLCVRVDGWEGENGWVDECVPLCTYACLPVSEGAFHKDVLQKNISEQVDMPIMRIAQVASSIST